MSILADFKNENPDDVLRQIIHRIEETTEGNLSLLRYFNQLRVLAQLRNLELNLQNVMESIAKYISEERDVLYMRGAAKAETQTAEKIITNLLTKTNHTLAEIADFAGETIDFVIAVQQKLTNK